MWMYLPSTCSASVPASADSTLELRELCQNLERSATWNGKRRLAKSWSRACKTVPWMTRLSGRILQPSIASRGAASWIASLLAPRAREILSPAKENSKTTTGTSGRPRGESYGTWDRDGSFWKTSSVFLFQEMDRRLSQGYLASWPRTGSMRSGSLYRRPEWEPAKNASGFFCWLAPMTPNGDRMGARTEEGREGEDRNLEHQGSQWCSPAAGGGGSASRSGERIEEPLLAGQAALWISPRASMAENGSDNGSAQRLEQGPNPGLKTDAATWAIPAATDGKRGSEMSEAQRTRKEGQPKILNYEAEEFSGRSRPDQDSDLTALWQTFSRLSKEEMATAAIDFLRNLASGRRGSASSHPGPTSRRQLNTAFVEWLMGFPAGWVSAERISCEPLEMQSYPCRPVSLSRSSGTDYTEVLVPLRMLEIDVTSGRRSRVGPGRRSLR